MYEFAFLLIGLVPCEVIQYENTALVYSAQGLVHRATTSRLRCMHFCVLGLHDKHARSFDTCNGRQRNTTSQEVKQSRQWHLSHDSLKTTDCHDGHVIQVHNVYRSSGDYPGVMNDPKSLKPALNSSESEPSDGVMAAKDVKLSEKSISSYADKSSVNEIDIALEGRCETDEVCIRPNKLPIDTSQDFITISSHKDRYDTFPREQQQQPKLSSFSSTASCSKSTAMGNAGRPDSSNDVIGVTDCLVCINYRI